eukprot:4529947-Alexandrium_andersonii.AAC.1
MSNLPHLSAPAGAHDVPEVAMDYCFLTKNTSETTLTVAVIKDRNSRAILAHPALRKGRLHDDTVGQAVASIRKLGHHRR